MILCRAFIYLLLTFSVFLLLINTAFVLQGKFSSQKREPAKKRTNKKKNLIHKKNATVSQSQFTVFVKVFVMLVRYIHLLYDLYILFKLKYCCTRCCK